MHILNIVCVFKVYNCKVDLKFPRQFSCDFTEPALLYIHGHDIYFYDK